MRFLYKRPKLKEVEEDIASLFEVMGSSLFILLDLIVFSIIFTLLMQHVLQTFFLASLFFIGIFSIFSCLYFIIFSRFFKDKLDFRSGKR
jgi:hypothetical protein